MFAKEKLFLDNKETLEEINRHIIAISARQTSNNNIIIHCDEGDIIYDDKGTHFKPKTDE